MVLIWTGSESRYLAWYWKNKALRQNAFWWLIGRRIFTDFIIFVMSFFVFSKRILVESCPGLYISGSELKLLRFFFYLTQWRFAGFKTNWSKNIWRVFPKHIFNKCSWIFSTSSILNLKKVRFLKTSISNFVNYFTYFSFALFLWVN